jgi:hypothetical protein
MKRATPLSLCIAALALSGGLAGAEPANTAPVAVAKKAPRHHCKQCGVVQSTHYVNATPGEPAYFEFVVRMRDGSIRKSRVSSLYKWRAGDHVMIGGGEGNAW